MTYWHFNKTTTMEGIDHCDVYGWGSHPSVRMIREHGKWRVNGQTHLPQEVVEDIINRLEGKA